MMIWAVDNVCIAVSKPLIWLEQAPGVIIFYANTIKSLYYIKFEVETKLFWKLKLYIVLCESLICGPKKRTRPETLTWGVFW